MIKAFLARLKQGHRTIPYPAEDPALPSRFRGRPVVDSSKCPQGCRDCAEVCPTSAITIEDNAWKLDLGKCLFCTDCADACPQGALTYSRDWRMAGNLRSDLIIDQDYALILAGELQEKSRSIFGRSLKLRQVSAGGCNACEADVNVLNTVVFDLGRFGIQFVASPRHADGLLITGPVTTNMKLALKKTYEAVPHPKIVIAVGACAVSGGPYIGHSEVGNGADSVVTVDLYIPGCPPHPITILDGILRLLGKLERKRR